MLRFNVHHSPSSSFWLPNRSTFHRARQGRSCVFPLRSFGIIVAHDEELSFALITPRSIAKSRTGGIMARLLSTPGIHLVGARMYSPSEQMLREYEQILKDVANEDGYVDEYEQALVDFVTLTMTKSQCEARGINNRVLLLLFKGKDAMKRLRDVIGDNLPPPAEFGKTIRGTYGEYSVLDGKVIDFHSAVLTATTPQSNRKTLQMFAKYADADGGVMKPIRPNPNLEVGLVMIKPDNLRRPSALPGHIIDLFGTTGLHLIGARVFGMSLQQANEFYGFLETVFVNKLAGKVQSAVRDRIDNAFSFKISDEEYTAMANIITPKYARSEMNKIIEYMTGLNPHQVPPELHYKPGPAKCLALLYRGVNAIPLLRAKLGNTDPTKAEEGTIRIDYGHDLMRNGAHASDSIESAERERRIVGLLGGEPSMEKVLIENWLASTS